LAVMNTCLASVVAGGLGVLVAPLISLDAQTLAFQVVPALGAALLAGFTSYFVACFAGLAIGIFQSLLIYWGTQSWFPTDSGGAPLRGLSELFVFLVIVLALFLRGASLPVRLQAGTDQLAARHRHLSLPRRHHRLRRPDLGRAARARRCRRLHDVPPHDGCRRRLGEVPDLASDRSFRGDDRRASRRRLGSARPRREPGDRHALGGGRTRAVRLSEREVGRWRPGIARRPAGDRRSR